MFTRSIPRSVFKSSTRARSYTTQKLRRSGEPSRAVTIGLTAGLTATACYAYNLLRDGDASKVYAEGHYADLTTASKGIEKEVKKTEYRFADKEATKKAIAALKGKLGAENVSEDMDERLGHAQAGGTHHHPAKADVVVYVESTQDVVEVMKIANEFDVPVVPYSGGSVVALQTPGRLTEYLSLTGGTSLEGHITAPYGGICVDLSRMDKVIALNGMPHSFLILHERA
jgi:hypothetical protein